MAPVNEDRFVSPSVLIGGNVCRSVGIVFGVENAVAAQSNEIVAGRDGKESRQSRTGNYDEIASISFGGVSRGYCVLHTIMSVRFEHLKDRNGTEEWCWESPTKDSETQWLIEGSETVPAVTFSQNYIVEN